MSAQNPNCQRWMWIELIGFDNTEPDYHVQAFLDNAGFVPEMLSFLLTCPDFLHMHEGMGREINLSKEHCAYGGRPYNAERQRQEWTNWQFRGLIQELQKHGIKVFYSTMNAFQADVDGRRGPGPWCSSHPEIWETRYAGQDVGCISPLKHLADGTLYEDFYVPKLREVLSDYGFDGFHAADGVAGPRRPIWVADYSDDMVGQFLETMGPDIRIPKECDGDLEASEARAQHIWAHRRRDWCTFYARRFEQFFTKVCSGVHDLGKQVVANNVWTQDPFAAFYRYGVDYRGLQRAGVDALILETVGAGNEIGAEGRPVELRFELNTMLLFTKACLPRMPLMCLNGTGDTTENWDVLNHAPPVCEREHYTLGSMFLQGSEGFRHASNGPFVCLADGITCQQWRWMARNWQVGYEQQATRALGATVVWSEAALEAEFDDYARDRVLTRHKLCAGLMRLGAPLLSVARANDLPAAGGCLLVPRPELLPEDELQRVMGYEGTVVVIGRNDAALPPAELTLPEGPAPEHLCLRVYRPQVEVALPEITPLPTSSLPEEMPEPPSYIYELYFRPASEEFLQACGRLLVELTQAPVVVNGVDDARMLAYETAPDQVRLLIGNEAHHYAIPQVDLRREIAEVKIASHYPGKPIEPQGTTLTTRVPPRGMVVLDLRMK